MDERMDILEFPNLNESLRILVNEFFSYQL